MKLFDILLLILSLTLTAGTAWAVLTPGNSPARVEIQTQDSYFVFPLGENRQLPLKGPLGGTTVYIENGEVFVHDSACTNKLCIAMGKIKRRGQWVACLPNHIFVRITGGSEDSVDVRTY